MAHNVVPDRTACGCAGCSTGEEAYTIGMVLEEHATRAPGFTYSVLATDISTRVLSHAQTAIYSEDRIDPIPFDLRQKYLLRSRDASRRAVRIAPVLRSRVAFRRLNFMDASYNVNDAFDAIFFRNVMIYFDRVTQEAVVKSLCRKLVSSGHLFLGHSESLAHLNVPLRQVAIAVYAAI